MVSYQYGVFNPRVLGVVAWVLLTIRAKRHAKSNLAYTLRYSSVISENKWLEFEILLFELGDILRDSL